MGTPYVHGVTLGDLFEHNAFEQMEAIRAIAGVAVSECAIEAQPEVSAGHMLRRFHTLAPHSCVHVRM